MDLILNIFGSGIIFGFLAAIYFLPLAVIFFRMRSNIKTGYYNRGAKDSFESNRAFLSLAVFNLLTAWTGILWIALLAYSFFADPKKYFDEN